MLRKRIGRSLTALVVFVAAAVAWFQFSSRTAAGQQPLVAVANLSELRAEFNKAADQTRIILLLSPT